MQARLPDFLIIGAQKCGTTWLHHQLSTHPDIFLPENKDHEFFSYTHNPEPGQIEAWSERYQSAQDSQIIGDATASYFWSALPEPWQAQPEHFNPAIPATVKKTLGDQVKLIVILRDPAERAVSAYLHHISMGSLSVRSDIFSAPKKLGVLSIGFYGQHLANWMKEFSGSNLYIEQRAIKTSHQAILDSICRFLGVTGHDFTDSNAVVYRGMRRIINHDGVWLPLANLKDISNIKRALPISTQDGQEYLRVIHPAELKQLQQMYAADQEILSELLTNKTHGQVAS